MEMMIIGIAIASILAAVGLALIVTKSFLCERLRFRLIDNEALFVLVNCPQCMSFWCGLLCSAATSVIVCTNIYTITLYCLGMALISSFVGEIIEKTVYENEK
jgi:hypothetical protein